LRHGLDRGQNLDNDRIERSIRAYCVHDR
jgi:hypothetical protein